MRFGIFPTTVLSACMCKILCLRSRVRAIDQQWEEVNVRATNTLDNIEEDDLDRLDPGRNRRGSDVAVNKRRDAGMYYAYTFIFKLCVLRLLLSRAQWS